MCFSLVASFEGEMVYWMEEMVLIGCLVRCGQFTKRPCFVMEVEVEGF